ncbi:MAG: PAS domain S-box protein, partial [Bacteroidetes bacterium]|nr:PAS domain S-box protein [Bacteroidota bacterium]
NTTSDAIFLTDTEGIITYVNSGFTTLYGYTADEVVSKVTPRIIKSGLLDKEVYEGFWKTLKNKTEVKGEILNKRKNGELVIIDEAVSPIFDEQKAIIGFLGIQRDINESKMAEQAVKVSEEKYKTILDASPDGIILIDMEGIITEVSEIGLELFGADTRDDLVGKDILLFVPSDGKKIIREIIEKTTNEGLVQNIGLKIKKKNKSLFLSEISVTLIRDPDGAPFSFMLIMRDISQRKKTEAKQIHADRMANLGEMATGIAHEINQPLNIISMIMDKILFESAKTETIDFEFLKNKSDKFFENITRIRNIIDHIRAFSRSHDDYILTAFNINSSIENAVSMISEQFKHLAISLNLQLEKQIPQIIGNTYKFEQIILNLLSNAKDALLEKKSKQEEYFDMIIGIKSYQEKQCIIIEVTDNGLGISDEDINNIMLPFYTTKDAGKGTGLGLSICYQIIKEMDGTIDITSNRSYGTKMKIVLDIQKEK